MNGNLHFSLSVCRHAAPRNRVGKRYGCAYLIRPSQSHVPERMKMKHTVRWLQIVARSLFAMIKSGCVLSSTNCTSLKGRINVETKVIDWPGNADFQLCQIVVTYSESLPNVVKYLLHEELLELWHKMFQSRVLCFV